jgi:hypothetical protein
MKRTVYVVGPQGQWCLPFEVDDYPDRLRLPGELPSGDGYYRLKWKPKVRRGPKSKPAQEKVEKQLALLPPGLTVAEKAKRLEVSESTIYRLARKKS